MNDFAEVSTGELKEVLGHDKVSVIDVRPAESYNGWALHGESRRGHIAGARSLPAAWAEYIDWIEIVRNKGLHPRQHMVIYGHEPAQSQNVASRFRNAGYGRVWIYPHFTDEWVPDPRLPMDHLRRYSHLIYPAWIKDIVDGKIPPGHHGSKTVICHAHYRNRDAYLSGHIPGAIDLDTNALESAETWNRKDPEQLRKALLAHGIRCDTTVVLYGKYMHPDNQDEFPGSSAGDIGAIRCAFIMMYAGVEDVRVLNGGFHHWEKQGYEVHKDDVQKTAEYDFGRVIPACPRLAVDTPEAKQMLASDNAELVCVRSLPEYLGEVSGYNYIQARGRIPGAVFAECGTDAYHMENYRNLDYTTREFHETARIWNQAGITPDKHLAFYCGTGWRGSEAWFNAWLMGWPRVSVYDGGWFEWSNNPENPIETGPAQRNQP